MNQTGIINSISYIAPHLIGMLPKIALLIGCIFFIKKGVDKSAAILTLIGTVLICISIIAGVFGTLLMVRSVLTTAGYTIYLLVVETLGYIGAGLFIIGFIIHIAKLKPRNASPPLT